MAKHNTAEFTVHGVLAGAYARDISAVKLLRHASQDEGGTAVCKKVKEGNLCDMAEEGEATCPVCLERIATRGLKRKES
jgi:hypothetical protein